jgi:acyl carrier protein
MLDQTAAEQSETAVEAWLTERIATYVRQPRDAIQPETPLTEYGLDSVYALTLIGDIEDYLGLQLDPTIMWDFPSVRALTTELVRIKCEASSYSYSQR